MVTYDRMDRRDSLLSTLPFVSIYCSSYRQIQKKLKHCVGPYNFLIFYLSSLFVSGSLPPLAAKLSFVFASKDWHTTKIKNKEPLGT